MRWRKLIFWAISSLITLIIISQSLCLAASQSRNIIGPEKFIRTTGATTIYTRTFIVPSYVGGPYQLHIDNGNPLGTNRVAIEDAVSSGRVILNGIEVVSPSEFSKITAIIDKIVTLSTGNTLEVQLNSAPDSYITLTISGIIPLGDMGQARSGHTATILSNGKVLITGGSSATGILSSVEIFDPDTLTSSAGLNQLTTARAEHTATLLPDTGALLVAGNDPLGTSFTAELFDPLTGGFSPLSNTLKNLRSGHTATQLQDSRVLIVGGADGSNIAQRGSEAFDPRRVDLFDPKTGTFTFLAQGLNIERIDHTATLLPDGRVLILGGRNSTGTLQSAEIFDPVTASFTPLAGQMIAPRSGHTATLLPDGRVLIAGGKNIGGLIAPTEIFDPATQSFTALGQNLIRPRANHTATLLPSGEILIAGGDMGMGPTQNTELYGPPTIDITQPLVVSISPGNTATKVFLNAIISIRFSEPINVTTLSPSSLTITGPAGALPGIVSPGESGLLAFFVPNIRLSPGTIYTIALNGITDMAGNPLPPFTSSFTTYPAPSITGFSPSQGPPGTVVTISGENFDAQTLSNNKVFFFDNIEASVAAATATTLTVSVPGGAANGPITVSTPGGQTTSLQAFIVALPPTISGFNPTSGSVGTTVTISGSDFEPIPSKNIVRFNGILAQVEAATPTMLTVRVPAGATTGPISVTTPGGTTTTTQLFIVNPPPTITGFMPTSGSIGTTVTITGTNLDKAPTQVTFNGIKATITRLTANTITTNVPIGATTGPIVVTTKDGSAQSQTPFTVKARQDFSISAGPSIASVVQGKEASYGITIASIGPDLFSGLVDLSISGIPIGANYSFNPRSATSNTGSILTITTSASTPAVESNITITGTATIDGIKVSKSVLVKLRVLAVGATTLKGKIFRSKESDPIPGVKVSIGSLITNTDQSGVFFFENPPIGDQIILIDGTPVSTQNKVYPVVPIPVTIATGQANELGYTLYLQEQDIKNVTPIDPTKTTIVTDPEIPDYQMIIPQGVRIIGWDGQPNTQVSVITTTPDRIPIPPLPQGVETKTVFLYYFGKPGGGIPDRPIEVTYPNDLGALPGERIQLWYYDESLTVDPNSNQWKKYGMGTVSPNAKKIIPDPGAGIPKFCCGGSAAVRIPTIVEILNLLYGSLSSVGGDPVNMATGLLIVTKTDMVLPGRIPITITRTYRTQSNVPGPFGIGTSMNLDLLLSRVQNTIYYIMPGASRVTFSQQPDGSFINTTEPDFRGVIITQESGIYSMTFKDGTIFRFDSNGRLIEQEDRNQNKITIQRDSSGRAFRILTPDGRALDISSDASGRITSIRDPIGREIRYTYNLQGFLDSVTDPSGGITRYTYDQGRMINITDPRNIVFLANNYDASNSRVSQQTGPTGEIYNFKYTAFGSYITESSATDPKGNITTYRFNNFSYPTEIIDPLGQKTVFERRPFTNELLSVTDPLGRKTIFAYDDKANVTSITDPQGNITRFTYEPILNRLTKITDALGNITSFTYDARGNLIKTTDPLGNIITIAYNTFGQPISVTDPLGNTTSFEYDQAGNLIITTDPLGNKTRRAYDLVSRLIQITDPRGKSTGFGYDSLNRVTQITDAIGGLTRFSYDLNGNLLTVADAKGNTTTYTYDSMDRLATRTDPLLRKESYAYDLNGNLTSFTDRKGQVSAFAYDPLNRRISATYADSSTTQFVYDAVGRLANVTDSLSGTIAFTYDNLDRLVQEITGLGDVQYTYDAIGRRTTMTANGLIPVTYSYDASSRLTQVAQGTQVVGLGYDTSGRRTTLTYPNGVTTNYSYDIASRLTRILHQGPTAIIEDLTYAYDAAGNRISFTRANGIATLLPGPVQAAYDAANEQIQFNSSTPNLSYDANGNLTSQADANGTTTYSWDVRNRLIVISGPNLTASFKYDPLGRRIEKTVNAQTTQYLYDIDDIVQEVEGGSVTTTYLRSLFIDEAHGILTHDGIYYYIYDALGSTIALTDSTRSIAVEYSYDPFGNTKSTNPTFKNPFQYTGRENDNTGLYYYRARYKLGDRFISEDPIEYGGGDVNLYTYVFNNPLIYTDPFGYFAAPYHGGLSFIASLATGYGIKESSQIALSDIMQDFVEGSQGTDAAHTNQHAMSGIIEGKYQTVAEAEAGWQNFIKQMRDAAKSGNLAAAGKALHAIEDSHAKEHAFNKWRGFGWNKETVKHLFHDFFPSPSDLYSAFLKDLNFLQQLKQSQKVGGRK